MAEIKGLSKEEVDLRIQKGQVNKSCDVASKTYGEIIRENVCTFFNGLNLSLALCVACVHSYRNMLFLGVVFWNTLIGIVQEVRAKKVLDHMALLLESKVFVWRDKERKQIPSHEVVLDDCIELHMGEQVCADVMVLEGICEVDESMLTGESDAVKKKTGDQIFSGSTVLSGQAMAIVIAVGENSYANQLVLEAKKNKKTKSEIRGSLDKIVKILSIIVVPLGIAMFAKQRLVLGLEMRDAVVKAVASIINMIPDGLVLLASMVMALGVLRLSKQKAIVQGLYSIENLARVDVLCLDKTGTITEGKMEWEETIFLTEQNTDEEICAYLTAMQEDNATTAAIRNVYGKQVVWKINTVEPFSSERKWGAVSFFQQGSYVLGAPEVLLGENQGKYQEQLDIYLEQGKRVVVFGTLEQGNIETKTIEKVTPLAFIVVRDKIREHAKDTFRYFQEEGVRLVVISGDHPKTVMQIAKRAGLSNAEQYMDARTIETQEDMAVAVKNHTVFGRVTPKQKKEIVMALQKQGHTVAMTGDGVNDVLALKQSDCGIVMDSGCDVARKTAKVVLEGSDFSVMPQVLAEGRRAINNLERSSCLFLTKTTFSALLLIMFLIVNVNYPLQPIQMTLIGALSIGVPAFLLALEPNYQVVTGSFLKKVFSKAVPTGMMALINIAIVVWGTRVFGFSEEVTSTMTVVGVASANFVLLFRLCEKWTVWKAAMMITLIALFAGAICFAGDIFYLARIPWKGVLLSAVIIVMDVLLYICSFMRIWWCKYKSHR